jgi:hypothetical protein
MSRTVPAEYRNFHFWAYDVSLSVLLAEMIAVAESRPCPWSAAILPELRVHAVVGADFHLPLDAWAGDHEEEFVALVTAACARLAPRGAITAAEAARWEVLDGNTVIWRGRDRLDVRQVVALGEAVVDIIRGVHPPAPAGKAWFLGTNEPGQLI